jgi:tetratricopeptide (TPR) repeat protein
MFLEKRVYQGSSGRVYPLPFIDRIAETPSDRIWDAIHVENEYVSVMMLPEIGGRIHAGKDLTNGYDFFYRQEAIKPALVGLAGPWASGGVEFNWPQHHRPSTFMPTDVEIEHGEDGSITVWMSEHEPMNRMKGMHGVCIYPGRSVIELKVRLYNRTPYTQTFLWWANIATKVHEAYRSFFPPDVHMVADHAKRATSSYPLCDDHYYGVDYGTRGIDGVPPEEQPERFVPAYLGGNGPAYAANDLSWYANIPVPTSYMCMGTKEDFFGGYDGFARAGLIHIADHHIAPGKKQWTWGNQEFGYCWDRNLSEDEAPYIELMAGVYTDNQPDFSFIAPGETKVFSQFWYPYTEIGLVHYANIEAALSVSASGNSVQLGANVTRPQPNAQIVASSGGEFLGEWVLDLMPGKPFAATVESEFPVLLVLSAAEGNELARYENTVPIEGPVSAAATEPPLPAEVASSDELFLIGTHLEQYRHATRDAAIYWKEALSRDPGDARCNNAMGLWHFKRGEFDEARGFFEAAISRSTQRNPNPYDGEPFYNLGLTFRFLGQDSEAADAFGKAIWNSAWQAPGFHALAELACKRKDWVRALDYLGQSLRKESENMRAKNLRAYVLGKLGQTEKAKLELQQILDIDPLDFWARHQSGQNLRCDNGTRIDLAIDCARAGLYEEALSILSNSDYQAGDGTAPMVRYYEAYYQSLSGKDNFATLEAAIKAPADYCFPARLEDIVVLNAAIRANRNDSRACYYLGNLLYDRRRHAEAITYWEKAVSVEPTNAIAHRNLGIAYFNILGNTDLAKKAYDKAFSAASSDARLMYERDQLWKRIGLAPEIRLAEFRKHSELTPMRDDLTIEFCALLNTLNFPEEAEAVMRSRKFQPWEGGEGQALGMFSRTHMALGRSALAQGDATKAKNHFEQILNPPRNLSEARHLLANASDVWLALGDACSALGETEEARKWWLRAAEFRGDFQEMSVLAFSEMTYFQALALERLGRKDESINKFQELDSYAIHLAQTEAKIDYFATSLPTMLLFDDDLQMRQENTARFMRAQAAIGLGQKEVGVKLLGEVLQIDPNHSMAIELKFAETK